MIDPNLGRRRFLRDAGAGLGATALAWLLGQEARAGGPVGPHHAPKARRVIQVFATGGVSHIDTFDYKPELERRHGQELTGKGALDPFFGEPGRLMKSPFTFRQRGRSGLWVSDLLPHLANCADDLTVIRSMVARTSNHTPATFQMNSGFTGSGFPCLGSWLSYGLGALGDNLPTFVILPDPRGLPAGGAINWTSGFLPAAHQGVAFRTKGEPVPDLRTPSDVPAAARRAGLDLLARMDRRDAASHPGDDTLDARLLSYEMAARMQTSIPEAVDFRDEPRAIRRLYGLDDPTTEGFGRNCLLARRLIERGVRFVQVYQGGAFGLPRINWDAHEDLAENHRREAAILDRPLAGLIADLKARGLLADTLLLWTTEFGRAPYTQGLNSPGRDHHERAFTCFLVGAGLRAGIVHGATDEVGYDVVEDPVTIYDFHATVLHLLGLDHTRLTYRANGRDYRMTDVHGRLVPAILA